MVDVVLVLGPHRSGTSATTRALSLLGARLPDALMGPPDDPSSGYWEPEGMHRVNEALLRDLGRTWDDCRPMPGGWQASGAAAAARTAGAALLDGWLGGDGPIVLKEPRSSRVAPVWLDVLDAAGARTAVVLTARPLVESARSLLQRDDVPEPVGVWLGLVHLLEAERHSRGRERMVAPFGALLRGDAGHLARLADLAGLPAPDERRLAAVGSYVDPALEHHRRGERGTERATSLLVLAERAGLALEAEGGPDEVALDALTAEVEELSTVGAAMASSEGAAAAAAARADIERLRADAELEALAARQARAAGADVERRLTAQLDAVHRSRSLRLAAAGRRLLGRSPAVDVEAPAGDVAFVLVVERGPLEWQSVLFVDSLRRWGGAWSGCVVHAVSPRPDRRPRIEVVRELERLGVEVRHDVVNRDESGYGTVNRIVAGAHLERTTEHEVLVVVDSDTLILRPPSALALRADVDLAARPVDHRGLSASPSDDEHGWYWRALCELAGIGLESIPATATGAGGESIRANYNGGLVAVRRSVGILQRCEELYVASVAAGLRPRPGAPGFRTGTGVVPSGVAEIFGSAQAAMSVAAWSLTDRIVELPPDYNVPIHLLDWLTAEERAAAFGAAVHVHYHWLLDEDIEADPLRSATDSPLTADQREWLDARLRWRSATVPDDRGTRAPTVAIS